MIDITINPEPKSLETFSLFQFCQRKAHQEEHEKIKDYGESINEETRNKYK